MGEVARLIASEPRWLEKLTEDYKIHVVRDGDLVSLKYNQIESPMHEPIVQECRGMVVDVERGKILAHPYNKFWNHGEALAAPIDWSTARVLEKLDGSLMTLYWDDRTCEWAVASSGTPCASGSFGDNDETFAQAFWRTFSALEMKTPDLEGTCFMFEFCDQPNRIVVKHDKPRIVLHGARDLATGRELPIADMQNLAALLNWEIVKSFQLASIDDCLEAATALDPLNCEGFVVVDAAFNRVKIKSPRYVVLHHMKGEATVRRAIELWQTGEAGELLTNFPEMAPAILPVHEALDGIAEIAATMVSQFGGLMSRKDFAARVSGSAYAAVAFQLFGREATADAAKAWMRTRPIVALERMIGGAA